MLIIIFILTLLTQHISMHPQAANIAAINQAEPHLWQQIAQETTHLHSTNQELQLQTSAANALSKYGYHYNKIDSELMQTFKSLHFFSQVLKNLACNNLHHGYLGLAKNVCQTTDDIDELQQRNAIIQYLQQNQEFAKELDALLLSLQSAETSFLQNFPHQSQSTNNVLQPKSLAKKIGDSTAAVYHKLFSNRYASEYMHRSMQYTAIISILLAIRFLYATDKETGLGVCRASTICSYMYYFSFDPLITKDTLLKIITQPGIIHLLTFGTFFTTTIRSLHVSYLVKTSLDQIYAQQTELMNVCNLINTTRNIAKLLNKHPEFTQLALGLNIIKSFTSTTESTMLVSPKNDSTMKKFFQLVQSKTFNQTPNYYFSWQGKITETHAVYQKIRTEFVRLWEELGALDAHLSAYKLLQSTQHFCIPTWTNSKEPILHLTNYWHPSLNPNTAVKNSIKLGGANECRNGIITGANAGGKTTTLTAIMISQILAQSIGIAPASQFFATPFARLHTYLDITTNLAANESLFMAQANRAEQLYKSILSCNSGQKSITVLDEIFTGTRADFAENASFEFAKTLGSIPHSICILATHFPKLTQLESLRLFTNYHAANAIINNDGTLSYPYKIIPGISTQNIADHILKRKGILKS